MVTNRLTEYTLIHPNCQVLETGIRNDSSQYQSGILKQTTASLGYKVI